MNVNITIAVDDALLARARKLAQARGMSLQALLRGQLERVVGDPTPDELVHELRERWAASGLDEAQPSLSRDTFYDDLLDRDGHRG